MKSRSLWIAAAVVCLMSAVAAQSQQTPMQRTTEQASANAAAPAASSTVIPRLIKFSGTLLDAQERPIAGPVGVTFALYSQQTGGAALWMETQNVNPDANGAYVVLLGANSTNGVPAELFAFGEARWLGMQVEQQPEHERILLVSVPYALKAGDAETLGGLPASALVTTGTPANTANSAAVRTPTASSFAAGKSSSLTTTPKRAGATPQAAAACSSVTSDGNAVVNSIALFVTACSVQSSLMTQMSINGFPGVKLAGNNAGRRWKTNIRPIPGALAKVERLRGVAYDRKSDGKHEIGVVAEEIGRVVPEVMSYEDNGVDARGVNYARITALLIQAVKEQQAQIRQQKAQIKALQVRLRRIETQPN